MEVLGYFVMICVGLILGSIGAGGSMLAVPVLVYVFQLDVETASAYSLFLVGVTSLTGAVVKKQQRLWTLRGAVFFAIPSVAGSFVSRKWVIVLIPEAIFTMNEFTLTKDHLLLGLFALLMVTSSLMLLLKKVPSTHTGEPDHVRLLLPGLMVGLVAGLVGAGGGFLIVPALILIARIPFSAATGTSLLIIACNALLGFCGDVMNRSIDWTFLFCATVLAVLGLLLGCYALANLNSRQSLQYWFAWFTLGTGISILLSEFAA